MYFPPRRWPRPSFRTRLAVALSLAIALGGCSNLPWLGGDKDPNPPSPLVKLAPEVDLTVQWKEGVGRGTDKRRLHLVPAFAEGRVFTADARGRVTAVNAADGRTLWQRDLRVPLSGGPDASDDRLVVGSTKGELLALSTADGAELWRADTDSEILSVPQLAEGLVVVHTLDDTVYAFDAATGEERWRFTSPAPVLILRGSSTPAVVPSGAVVGLAGGLLVKLDLQEGIPLWTVRVTVPAGRSELERITDIDADPIIVGDTVYVGTYNGDLAAVDLESGAVLWRRTLSVYSGLTANETALYVIDADDHVWAADPATGAGRWRQERLAHRHLSPPVLFQDMLIVGDLEGYLHGLAREDGRLLARTRIAKGRIRARPQVRGGRLYAFADDGTLAALTAGSVAGRAPAADAEATTAAVPAPAEKP